ncbi:MAG: hypothetical protein M3315_05375 [Actinomycetota bacterium]|nr:hypothetical protein [Actinomycetota bacterium]
MPEMRVESLEKVEVTDSEVRILANSGDLALVFPRALWESALTEVSSSSEPTSRELEELMTLKRLLKEHAEENSFATVLEDVPCGGKNSGQQFDLVLRPAEIFAATTGYLFLPVVLPEQMALLRASLEEDVFVEQAYIVGALAESQAFATGDERLKALSIRGRRCSSSRFELAPELWQVLSEKLGWRNVEPVALPIGEDRKEV